MLRTKKVIEFLAERLGFLPKRNGRISVSGLDADVEVVWDRWGIPHIFAQNLPDLFFAQGYVHALDRLFQMELNRRAALGTLSEVFGETTLEADRFLRRVGFRRVAEKELSLLDRETEEVLEAYCSGINAFLMKGKPPLECLFLRFRPDPWKPLDVLAWAKLMAWSLSLNWDSELLRERFLAALGKDVFSELEQPYPPDMPLVMGQGVRASPGQPFTAPPHELPGILGGGGSNNWVVDGAKSATGKPLLANDPHLVPQIPSVWYEIHLNGGGVNAIGASVPGLPGVVIGHNGSIAWGMTAAMVDVQDVYIEKFHPSDPYRYEFRGDWREAQTVREEIRVRGRKAPLIEEVVITHHGPIITPGIRGEERPLALRSAVLEPHQLIKSGLLLNRASSWEEFKEAIKLWAAPSMNLAYADVHGNIGYYLAGNIPLRPPGSGMVPAPGWTGEHEWAGYIPFDELPHLYNPENHVIVTANNKVVDEGYPHFILGEWIDGYRARRIQDLLSASGGQKKLSVGDFQAVQGDLSSLPGREMARHLASIKPQLVVSLPNPDEGCRKALEYLLSWDGRLSPESVAGAIYEVFRLRMLHNILEGRLGSLLPDYFGADLHPLASSTAYGFRSTSFLLSLMADKNPYWLENSHKTWEEVILKSLAETVDFLERTLGKDMSRWSWGKLHQVTFSHPLGRNKLMGFIFNRGPFPLGGDTDTVLQASFSLRRPYGATSWMPLYRQIVDLADLSHSVAMVVPGQSGHPASRHYADLVKPWLNMEYHPMLFRREEIEEHQEGVLVLSPN